MYNCETYYQYGYQDDGFFNINQNSNHDVDNDVVSNDSEMNSMDEDNEDDSILNIDMFSHLLHKTARGAKSSNYIARM